MSLGLHRTRIPQNEGRTLCPTQKTIAAMNPTVSYEIPEATSGRGVLVSMYQLRTSFRQFLSLYRFLRF